MLAKPGSMILETVSVQEDRVESTMALEKPVSAVDPRTQEPQQVVELLDANEILSHPALEVECSSEPKMDTIFILAAGNPAEISALESSEQTETLVGEFVEFSGDTVTECPSAAIEIECPPEADLEETLVVSEYPVLDMNEAVVVQEHENVPGEDSPAMVDDQATVANLTSSSILDDLPVICESQPADQGDAPIDMPNVLDTLSPSSPRTALEQEKRMRRDIANSNERRRMQSINAGFQNLRTLLPHRQRDKLSKASILQQTSDFIYNLEQEKAQLLTQNCQLKRLLGQQLPAAAGSGDSDSGADSAAAVPPRHRNHSVESEEMPAVPAAPQEAPPPAPELPPPAAAAEAATLQRQLAELHAQLEHERQHRLITEQRLRQLNSSAQPAAVAVDAQFQLAPDRSLSPPPSQQEMAPVQVCVHPAPQEMAPVQVRLHPAPAPQEMAPVQVRVHPAPAPQEMAPVQVRVHSAPAQQEVAPVQVRVHPAPVQQEMAPVQVRVHPAPAPQEVASLVGRQVVCREDVMLVARRYVTVEDPPPLSKEPAIEQPPARLYTPATTSRQNLDTIVEAIRHLEGDHLFEDLVPTAGPSRAPPPSFGAQEQMAPLELTTRPRQYPAEGALYAPPPALPAQNVDFEPVEFGAQEAAPAAGVSGHVHVQLHAPLVTSQHRVTAASPAQRHTVHS